MPNAPRFPYLLPDSTLVEFPISTHKVGPINIPISGGGYFRLLPYFLTKIALKALMHTNNPFVSLHSSLGVEPGYPKGSRYGCSLPFQNLCGNRYVLSEIHYTAAGFLICSHSRCSYRDETAFLNPDSIGPFKSSCRSLIGPI